MMKNMKLNLPILETVGIDKGEVKRPDAISVLTFLNGKSLCWDAKCVDTYTKVDVNNSAVIQGQKLIQVTMVR